MDLRRELDELSAHSRKIKEGVKDAVRELPDNPRITRLKGGAYALPSGDLQDNWSPFFHDFKAQHREVERIVDETPAEALGRTLGRIIETGRTGRPKDQHLKFHPDEAAGLDEAVFSPRS